MVRVFCTGRCRAAGVYDTTKLMPDVLAVVRGDAIPDEKLTSAVRLIRTNSCGDNLGRERTVRQIKGTESE